MGSWAQTVALRHAKRIAEARHTVVGSYREDLEGIALAFERRRDP
jgi:hypothetical protein